MQAKEDVQSKKFGGGQKQVGFNMLSVDLIDGGINNDS